MTNLSRNTVFLLLNNIGSAILSFMLAVIIGRALGEAGLGIYSTALAWVFPISLIADFGIGTLMTREVARDKQLTDEYLRAASLARLWLGGGLTLALVIFAPLMSSNPSIIMGLQISAPLILILPLFGNYTALFRAQQRMWPIPWLNLGMLAAQVSLTALVLASGGSVMAAFVANTLTSAGQLVAAWWVWRKWFRQEKIGYDGVVSLIQTPPQPLPEYREGLPDGAAPPLRLRGEELSESPGIKTLLRAAWPFAVAGVLAAVQTRMGILFLERSADVGSVGQYAAAMRFVEAGRMIPNAVFGAIFPMLVTSVGQSVRLQEQFRRLLGGLTVYGFLLGGLGMLFAPMPMMVTFGAEFAPAIPVLQIALWSLLPAVLRGGVTLYWYALKREQFVNTVGVVSLIVQFILSLIFIPTYGAVGAVRVSIVVDMIALIILVGSYVKRKPVATA